MLENPADQSLTPRRFCILLAGIIAEVLVRLPTALLLGLAQTYLLGWLIASGFVVEVNVTQFQFVLNNVFSVCTALVLGWHLYNSEWRFYPRFQRRAFL